MKNKILNNKKKILIIVSILSAFLILSITGVYAYNSWRTRNSNISLDTSCFNINYSKGQDISNNSLNLIDESDYVTNNQITISSDMAFTNVSVELDSTCYDMSGIATLEINVSDIGVAFTKFGDSMGTLKYVVAEYDSEDYPTINMSTIEDETFTYVARGILYKKGTNDIYSVFIEPGEVKNYLVILYADSLVAGDDVYSGTFEAKIDTRVEQAGYTPIEDFEYLIGTGTVGYRTYSAPSGYVLLVKYLGDNPKVIVPSKYTIDNIEYNTMLFLESEDYAGTFTYNDDITDVFLPEDIEASYYEFDNGQYVLSQTKKRISFISSTNLINVPVIPSSVTDISSTFSSCTNLRNAPVISSSVTNMDSAFSDCTSLVNVPIIPSSVTNIVGAFSDCTSLVNAPIIPSSITSMSSTFDGCASLINAPVIPSSVTDMSYTFRGCASLVNAQIIPSSVTNMRYAFFGCSSLSGTVTIESRNISLDWSTSTTSHPFYNAGSVTVRAPSGSTTYNSLNTNKPTNVTLVGY